MPGKYFPPTFNQLPADQAFVVGQPFLWSGRQYQPGEPFDRTQGTLAQVRRLYNGRKLTPAPKAPTAAEPGQGAAQGDDGLHIKHMGFGKWYVMRGEERIGQPSDKESAERRLAFLRDGFSSRE